MGWIRNLAALALLVPAALPAQAPDVFYLCRADSRTAVGMATAALRVGIDGKRRETEISWWQWPKPAGSSLSLRLTQPAGQSVAQPAIDSAYVTISVTPDRKLRRLALLRLFTPYENPLGLTLATLVDNGSYSAQYALATIAWPRLIGYAGGETALAWQITVPPGRSDSGKLLGSGRLDLAPLATVRAMLPGLVADVAAKADRYKDACDYTEVPYDPLSEI